jgi:hypothetical protein
MEIYPMLMDWQNEHSKNGYNTKVIHMFTEIPIKILMAFITEIEKSTLTFIWKHKIPRIDKAKLSKKSNAGSIIILYFNLHYRIIAIKTAWYWHKNRHKKMDMNPHSYAHLIFIKDAKNM